MKLTKIFEPITISKTEFKNRMVDFVIVGRRKEMIFHLSGRYRDRGITEHKSGDRHSAPAGCFCVEWQSGRDNRKKSVNLLGGMIKEMMEAEMDEHIGYENLSGQMRMTLNVIIETDTRINRSTPAMAACPSTFHRTVTLPLNLRS